MGIGKSPDNDEKNHPPAYAMDLIEYYPKHKFLFFVQFSFHPAYDPWSKGCQNVAFVIKRSTRPKVSYDYEEINMYNFRTRVPKRTVYEPVNMTFYDDNKNFAHQFYAAYMRAMSPVANMMGPPYEPQAMSYKGGSRGFVGEGGGARTKQYSASLGALEGDAVSILNEIRLFHVFDYTAHMNVYHFYRPKILDFSGNELTMLETGEGGEYEFSFAYDGLYIEQDVPTKGSRVEEFSGKSVGANYMSGIEREDGKPPSGGPTLEEQERHMTRDNLMSETFPTSKRSIDSVDEIQQSRISTLQTGGRGTSPTKQNIFENVYAGAVKALSSVDKVKGPLGLISRVLGAGGPRNTLTPVQASGENVPVVRQGAGSTADMSAAPIGAVRAGQTIAQEKALAENRGQSSVAERFRFTNDRILVCGPEGCNKVPREQYYQEKELQLTVPNDANFTPP